MQIGHKSSHVWLQTKEVLTARSVARNQEPNQNTAYFKKLIMLGLGEQKIQEIIQSCKTAKDLPNDLMTACEGNQRNSFSLLNNNYNYNYNNNNFNFS